MTTVGNHDRNKLAGYVDGDYCVKVERLLGKKE